MILSNNLSMGHIIIIPIVLAFFAATKFPNDHFVEAKSVPCISCCSPLFSSPDGVVKVEEKSFSRVAHTISFLIRCLLPDQESFIISDTFLTHPISLESPELEEVGSGRWACANVENMPMSIIPLPTFVNIDPSFYQRIITSRRQRNRLNFIFIPESPSQILISISKAEEILNLTKSSGKPFWQPNIIFVWPEIQKGLNNLNSSRNHSFVATFPGESLMQSWIDRIKPCFPFDSSILFIFTVQKGSSSRSKVNLHLSLWEAYSIKGAHFIERVRKLTNTYNAGELQQKELCRSGKRAKRVSFATEQVNAYVFLERYGRRGDLRNSPVIAFVKDPSEWISVEIMKDGTVELINGSAVSIYKDMEFMLNFSERISLEFGVQFSNSNETTVRYPNQSWGLPDISLNQESMIPSRALTATFLQPTYFGLYLAFFQQPSANTIRNIVSAPFTRTLWITFLVTWVVIVVSVYAWWVFNRLQFIPTLGDAHFVDEIGMWTVAAICQKSWYNFPNSSVYKVICCIGSLMALVCYAAYSAMIVSFLTVKLVPVKSLKDLVEHDYKFTAHERSEGTKDLAKRLIDNFKLPDEVIQVNTENEISHIFSTNHRAFLAYPDLFYSTAAKQNFTNDFICTNVSTVQAQSMPYKSALSIPKGSEFRELFNQKLLVLMERGLIHRYTSIYENSRNINCIKSMYDDEGKLELDPVRFTDVIIAFLVVFIGWAAACFMLSAEKIGQKRRKFFYLL